MRQRNNITSAFLLASLTWIQLLKKFPVSYSYPIVLQLEAHQETCIRFTLPDDDDAHMVFSALPAKVDRQVEDYMVHSLSHLSDENSHVLIHNIPEPSADVQSAMDEAIKKDRLRNSNVFLSVHLAGGSKRIVKNDMIPLFKPLFFENVAGGLDQDRKGRDQRWDPNLGTYNICFNNRNHFEMNGIYEFILMSSQEEKRRRKNTLKKTHFEPLEQVYEKSYAIGKTILNEMNNIQAREALMQKKSDQTGNKVRIMSLISVGVLIGVTYIQVTYLKNYFRKKKVL